MLQKTDDQVPKSGSLDPGQEVAGRKAEKEQPNGQKRWREHRLSSEPQQPMKTNLRQHLSRRYDLSVRRALTSETLGPSTILIISPPETLTSPLACPCRSFTPDANHSGSVSAPPGSCATSA